MHTARRVCWGGRGWQHELSLDLHLHLKSQVSFACSGLTGVELPSNCLDLPVLLKLLFAQCRYLSLSQRLCLLHFVDLVGEPCDDSFALETSLCRLALGKLATHDVLKTTHLTKTAPIFYFFSTVRQCFVKRRLFCFPSTVQ